MVVSFSEGETAVIPSASDLVETEQAGLSPQMTIKVSRIDDGLFRVHSQYDVRLDFANRTLSACAEGQSHSWQEGQSAPCAALTPAQGADTALRLVRLGKFDTAWLSTGGTPSAFSDGTNLPVPPGEWSARQAGLSLVI